MKKMFFRVMHVMAPVIVLLILVVALRALSDEIRHISLADILAQFRAIPWPYFLAAGCLTMLSYSVLTGYDWLALRWLGSRLSWRQVAPVAFTAFAVGHNVGISSLSGGAIRYRAYSVAGLSTTDIAAVLVFIPLSFALGASLLTGAALLLEPVRALAPLRMNITLVHAVGVALLLVPVMYLLLVARSRGALRIWRWQLTLPPLKIAVAQIVLAVTDLIIASLVMYVLLTPSADISYIVFLGSYLLAMVIGIVSAVPGAIGIFESSMVLLLPQVSASQLLGALLAYRLLYYLVPLFCAAVLIVIHELPRNRHRLRQAYDGLRWTGRVVPLMLALMVFVTGIYLLIRAILPSDSQTVALIQNIVPLPLLEMSHLLSSLIGAGLLILAHGLYHRLRRALTLTLVLLGAAIVVTVVQFHGIVHTVFLVMVMVLAWLCRHRFNRGLALLDQPLGTRWLLEVLFVLVIVGSLGFFVYRSVAYSHELWWQFSLDADASRMLRTLLASSLLIGLFLLARLLRGPTAQAHDNSPPDITMIRQIVATSPASEANVALLGDKKFFMHPSGKAFLMYRVSGRSWVVLGDPVGDPQCFEELLWRYRETCDARGGRCVFYQVSAACLSLYIELGLSFFKLGEEGLVNLETFNLEESGRGELRRSLNRARREGSAFSVIPAAELDEIMPELARVSTEWLKNKSVREKGFSLGYFDPAYLKHFDCAIIRREDRIVAFANLWKGGSGSELSVDLMRYSTDAPKGVMDHLFIEIMLWGKAEGFRQFNLGMAPLAGLNEHPLSPTWHKFGGLLFRTGEHFYNFEGLRHYKDKFDPVWEPKYLASEGGMLLPAVLLDVTTLIAGGVRGVLFK